MNQPSVIYQDLGIIEYGAALNYQEKLMQENLAKKKLAYQTNQKTDPKTIDTNNHLLCCSHPHVFTLGKSGALAHLLMPENKLKELGAGFYHTSRGGDITYHGPGQLVGYPILDLEYFYTDLGKYMRNLEEVIIQTIVHFGLRGERLSGATGVWLEPGSPKARKICAMGVRCSRWITMHGFALNMNTDLSYFSHIVPCGISDKGVTSMAKELGKAINEDEVKKRLKATFKEIFNVHLLENNGNKFSLNSVYL